METAKMTDLGHFFQTAIAMERNGRRVYLEAAEKVREPLVKSVLSDLANDELAHEETMTRYYEALEHHQGWPEPEGDPDEVALPERMLSMLDNTSSGIQKDPTFYGVYEVAVELERQSRDFYLAQAEVVKDRALVQFLHFLALVEDAHREALELLFSSMR